MFWLSENMTFNLFLLGDKHLAGTAAFIKSDISNKFEDLEIISQNLEELEFSF